MFGPTMNIGRMAVGGTRSVVRPLEVLRPMLGRRALVSKPVWKSRQPLVLHRCLTAGNPRRVGLQKEEGDGIKTTTPTELKKEEERAKEANPKSWRSGTAVAFVLLVTGASIYGFSHGSQSNPPEEGQSGSIEWRGKAVPPFTLKGVEAWLKAGTTSWSPDHWLDRYRSGGGGRRFGVERCDGIRLSSNEPCEDQMVITVQDVAGSEKGWLFWGVFDGHNGSAMSLTLKESLIPYVARNISQLYRSFSNEAPPSSTVDVAISSAFRQLDSDIMDDGLQALSAGGSFTETISRLAPFYAGSCALLSIYDPSTQILRTACAGDSRAVLGRRTGAGTYASEPLSVDQTGHNVLELEKIKNEHPGEENIVDPKSGRVLGIMVSRAFGDGLWKWPLDVVKECHEKYLWKPARPGYKSPPYLTAEPVITSTKIEGGEFLILASDGLWDCVSSEQAVKLVELWLVAKRNGAIGKGDNSERKKTQRANIWEKPADDEDFVVEDENCAAHLVRNAFGGRDHERLVGMAGGQPPFSRYVRDDVTVQVIFFKGVDV